MKRHNHSSVIWWRIVTTTVVSFHKLSTVRFHEWNCAEYEKTTAPPLAVSRNGYNSIRFEWTVTVVDAMLSSHHLMMNWCICVIWWQIIHWQHSTMNCHITVSWRWIISSRLLNDKPSQQKRLKAFVVLSLSNLDSFLKHSHVHTDTHSISMTPHTLTMQTNKMTHSYPG